MTLNIAISLMIISGAGMIFIYSRHYLSAANMTSEEIMKEVEHEKISWRYFSEKAKRRAECFYRNVLVPLVFKIMEKIISRVRLTIKDLERRIAKIDHRIRGKYRIMRRAGNSNGGKSKYWGGIVKFKNGLNGKDGTSNEGRGTGDE